MDKEIKRLLKQREDLLYDYAHMVYIGKEPEKAQAYRAEIQAIDRLIERLTTPVITGQEMV